MSQDTTVGVRLDQLFPSSRANGAADAAVRGCTSDWRQVQPGDAFVCVLGDDDDGHDAAERAVERGAAAIVAEQLVPIFSVPLYVVEDSRIALGQLSHELAGRPSRQVRVIGVVGTQGKSTVAALLEAILAKAGAEVGVLTSMKTFDGMAYGPGRTEPLTPTNLAARLARMEATGCTHAVVELSSLELAQRRTAGLELDAVAVTCVGAARLELHHNVENYRRAVRRAFEHLSPQGVAVLNVDDQVCCRWLATLPSPSLTYGIAADAQITAQIVERNACETVFVLTAGCESAAVRTTIVGDHHVSNCLAAAAVALTQGVDLPTIAAGLEAIGSLPARMERVDCGQDFAVFVDAADNPSGLRAALRAARQLARRRLICVLGEGSTVAPDAAALIRSIATRLADVVIVTDAVAAAHDAWSSDASTDSDIQIVADRGEAIVRALATARQGDIVVVAGSGGAASLNFATFETNDAHEVRELLYARSQPMLRLAG